MSVFTAFQRRQASIPSPKKIVDRRTRLIVVGNGPVGFRLLRTLVQKQALTKLKITVFGEEETPAYDRVHLTDYFKGQQLHQLIYESVEWYREHGIELITGQRIVEIDRENSTVLSNEGLVIPYDSLVLATGSRPYVPSIPGVELPGVFVYRTIRDVLQIKEYASTVRSAVVLGGGLLGLEAARALRDEGISQVHVVQNSAFLMSRQLNMEAAAVLQSHVESLGLRIHLNCVTERISPHENQLALRFKNGESLQTQLVVIAAGIRPRDELAVQCGLPVAASGGVKVDDEMRTSDPRIFACGECASHRGLCYGLVAPGFQMADVVADHLLPARNARPQRFESGDLSSELKLLGVNVASLGETLNPSQGSVEYLFRDRDTYRKITIAGHRLVGVMFVGEWEQRHLIRDAVGRKRRIWKRQIGRFLETGNLWKSADNPPLENWPADSVICNCTMTTKGEIRRAIEQTDATVDSVRRITGASTVCGSCLPLVAQLCGSKSEVVSRPQYALLSASVVGLLAIVILFLSGPAPAPQSVKEDGWFDSFLENEFWKQVTGFSLLGLTAMATVLSLRKRWPRFQWGDYLHWRAFHGWVAAITLVGVYWHTGFRMGSHLNFVLFATFVSANLMGCCTGLVTSLETSGRGTTAAVCRSIRPWMTWIHIVGLWPLPVLIVFHILAAYFYN